MYQAKVIMQAQTHLHRQPIPQAATRREPQPPAPKSRRWLPYAVLGGFAAAAVGMTACALLGLLVIYLNSSRIPDGVTIASIPVGGEKVEEAQAALQAAFQSAAITIADGTRTQPVSLGNLGIGVDYEATLAQAQEARPGTDVAPVYTVDLMQAQSALIALSEQFNIQPTTEAGGRAVDIPVVLDRLRSNLAGELADGVLDLAMIDVEPLELTAENYSGESLIHVVEPGQELGLISKQYNVPIDDLVSLNGITDPDLLYVGQELLIPASGEYVPTAAEAPPPSTTVGKAIVVSVGKQRIYAFENGELIRSHMVSTGLPQTPTVLGDYSVYVKYTADDMSGPGYFLPQVPYTMYFYQGYAIHGTYWHNAFGRQMSRGCVNLPVDESEWFFNWAQVGTPVRVVA